MTKIESNNTDEIGKEYFQLPIYHLTDKIETDQNVIKDPELVEYKDVSNNNVYQDTFKPVTTYGKEQSTKWVEYFTSNQQFMKDSQTLCKNYDAPLNIYDKERFEKIKGIWNLIDNDDGFIDKYQYIDIEFLEKFNHEPSVLQALTIYNLSAPSFSLASYYHFNSSILSSLKMKGLPLITLSWLPKLLKTLQATMLLVGCFCILGM